MTLKDLKGMILILFFAVVTAFFYNHFSPFGIALFGQWDPANGGVTPYFRKDSAIPPSGIKPIGKIKASVKEK